MTTMVKGARLRICITIVFMTIIYLAPTNCKQDTKIFTINHNGHGAYSFEYETVEGTFRREEGGIISKPEGDFWIVRGQYGYIDSNGKPYSIIFVADKNGYHPEIHNDDTRFNDRKII